MALPDNPKGKNGRKFFSIELTRFLTLILSIFFLLSIVSALLLRRATSVYRRRHDLNCGLVLLIPLTLLLGCVSQPEAPEGKTITVEPVIDYYSLGGFTEKKGEALYILTGDISDVKKQLEDILVTGVPPRDTFHADESLNLVVFRGVFSTGGYGIEIDKVDIAGHALTIHAIYTNPGPGMIVTQAFTHPTAIIPLAKLPPRTYQAKLLVTTILMTLEGGKVFEEGKDHESIRFTVK